MGIDCYLLWKAQTEAERKLQFTGFAVDAGNVGYLREAYHGGPYATQVLLPEGFKDDLTQEEYEAGIPIPAAVLRARLPETLLTAAQRSEKVYGEKLDENDPVLRAFIEFVELAERKEAETGEPARVRVSY